MSVEQYLHAAPKAELHVHLEGAIQPATILALAKRNKIDISASIWGAIFALGAERIAHEVRAIEDPALVNYLTVVARPS